MNNITKNDIRLLPLQHKRRRWIVRSTRFFISTLSGSQADDEKTGVKTALAAFADGATAANAIYQGFDAARQQIKARLYIEAEQLLINLINSQAKHYIH